jgi:hypothetical protein
MKNQQASDGDSTMETQRFRIPTSFLIFFAACGALVIFGCVLTPYFTARPGHDQTSYLLEAERMLAGVELYGPHLSETNPPTIIWFSALPVLLARWLHGPPMFFLRLIVLALIFGSVAWCVRILRRSVAITNPLGIGVVALAVVVGEFCIGPYNFSQREVLLVVLIVPYLLACATGAVSGVSRGERFALGVAAGLAIWFKPQDALVIVGLEVFLAFRGRSLRRVVSPEFLGMVGTGALVLLLIRFLAPLYFKVTVPLLFETYWALGTMNTVALALHLHYYLMEVLVVLAAYLLLRRSLRDGAGFLALLVCSITAFIAFDMQHNDWWYHAYPHQALFVIAVGYMMADLFNPFLVRVSSEPLLLRRVAFVSSGCVVALLCMIAVRPDAVLKQGTHQGRYALDDYLAQYEPSTTVYAFSTRVEPMAFSYNHGLSWGGRFAHLWMLPAIVKNELGPIDPAAPFKKLSPETVTRLANLQRTESTEDLKYWQPSVVLVEQCNLEHDCIGLEGRDFDLISWFLQSPEFAAVWSHYERQTEVDNFTVYKLVR